MFQHRKKSICCSTLVSSSQSSQSCIVFFKCLNPQIDLQVRNTGPVDIVTRQPLKGRKRGGGGRVGEMERDALISHGVPYVLQDRFTDCSDKSTVSAGSREAVRT